MNAYDLKLPVARRSRFIRLALAFVFALLVASTASAGDVTLVPQGATWRYLDTLPSTTPPPLDWNQPGFDDQSWAAGPAPLGYGEGDEATVIGSGPDPNDRYITAYFRHTFSVVDPNAIQALRVGIERDDGAIVYLNGVEALRTNMPFGPVDGSTTAANFVTGEPEGVLITRDLDPALLVAGDNVVAVELHQWDSATSDASFRLDLVCVDGPLLLRGPYLQRVASDRATVHWRTANAQLGRLRYGSDPNALSTTLDGPVGLDHEVEITGLSADTRYYYAVETATTLLAGADDAHTFRTAPVAGTDRPTRIWVTGEAGADNLGARDVRDDFLLWPAGGEADVWLSLGNAAYDHGTDTDYLGTAFTVFPRMLARTPLWPAFGSLDAHAAFSPLDQGIWFDVFGPPTAGEAGGTASGTEGYYSFDHANVHFIVLDSQFGDPDPGGTMMTWAVNDLAATTQDWVIAIVHHPPYTQGSKNSDSSVESEGRLRDVRQDILPVLESAGVDLVLSAHSQAYERSMLLDGHYGSSASFSTSTHAIDAGDGCICPPGALCPECPSGGSGAYDKPTVGTAANEGTVYAVVGSASEAAATEGLDHPAMRVGLDEVGAMIVDVSANRLDAVWIERGGTLRDRFTLRKGDDEDGDGVVDGSDVCPYTANALQDPAACLCGDVNADGAIDVLDATLARRNAASLAPGVSAPALCPLGGCADVDAALIRRDLALLPALLDRCRAATPAPCGDGVCAGEADADCPLDCGCSALPAACGGGLTPGGCFCDPSCVTFGDCCADVCEVCGSGC